MPCLQPLADGCTGGLPNEDALLFSMQRMVFLALVVGLISSTRAQSLPTWVDDIAPIVHTHCAHCHHNGGAGPFPLITYEDVFFTANMDVHVIQDGEMPPWPADPSYQHFVGENVLSDQDKSLFVEWYETGMAYGDEEATVELPTFGPQGSLLESVDFVADFPEYTLQSNAEEYRWFVVPTDFEETRYIQAVEVIPGLPAAVHHADIFVDATGESMVLDVLDPLPGFNGSTGWPTNTTYINAWQPGALPARYPDGWGIPVPPGADLVIEIHYGPDFGGEVDDTVMNLEWVDEPEEEVRPISVGWLLGNAAMTDGPLVIPPDVISTFHQEAVLFNSDKSLLSICPHMHLLGKSYKVWMETPEGDSIPLIDIPQWQFEWQFYYRFLSPVHVPAGTLFKSEGEFDNTIWNPLNPNNPPEVVTYGSLTSDEMFLTYFIWADYEEGDEELVFGEVEVSTVSPAEAIPALKVWPTLAESTLRVHHEFPRSLQAVVRTLEGKWCWSGTLSPGTTALDVANWPSGSYVIQVGLGSAREIVRWVKP